LISSPPKLNVLELGSGTGVVGIAAVLSWHSKVTITDLPSFLPKMQENVNQNLTVSEIERVSCLALEWGLPIPVEILKNGPYDLILVSDCIYKEELFQPLINTIIIICQNSADCQVLIAQQVRRKADKRFWKLMKKGGFCVNEIDIDTNGNSRLHIYECKYKK
jgi:predicted nicotinamide N-methyase